MLSQLSNNSLFTKNKNFDFTYKNNDTREIWNIFKIEKIILNRTNKRVYHFLIKI